MSAPQEVIRLVETFRNNIESLKSGNYNETQVRREFIDPFFDALGWDVFNKNGYAEAYKDVIHEYSQKTTDTTKNPDYCFRIGGKRKFFVEAKKPSVNLKDDIHPAYQLRRYGWSAKLSLCILTDFEEFAVYDCRVTPKKNDKASTARVMFLTYEDYIDKWDELVNIFSKEAILKGSFDKYAESNKKKRGTANVDEAFLKEMEEWRNILARNIALRNSKLSIRELNYAVQKTIDRIIFLRICEDRGIENYGQLMNLLNGNNVYERLKQIFTRADEKYNSGLFHFEKEKDRNDPPDEITPTLQIDDKTLKDIIKKLYYPESPYEFSVLPADILGHVYEQFLGKVIRLTPAHFAVVEDKPEVKKAGGVYYTPTYIVEYIVKNTVGKILEKKTPKQVANISILDPACGSGSFLLGAYQYLLDWHLKYYTENAELIRDLLKKKKPPIYQIRKNEYLLTTTERKRILLNNIFGVDIDSQAVEVTKLSLLLKVLEGESEETLQNQFKMFRERALPDLANNIKCGNSLIGPDFYDQLEMNFLDDEEKLRINVFDWESEFPNIFNVGGLARRSLKDEGGFDVVIGNPPWIQSKFLNTIEKKYYGNKYAIVSNQYDLFCLFTEKSMKLLNKKGIHSFIVPNRFFTNHDYYNFRKFLIDSTGIKELFDVGEKIFDKVEMPSAIYLLTNNSSKVIKYKYVLGNFLNNKIVCNQVNIDSVKKDEFLFFKVTGSIDLSVVCEKIKTNNPLKNFVTNARGVEIGKKSEVISNKKSHNSVKFLVGEDVSRYNIENKNRFLIKGKLEINYKNNDLYEGDKILLRKTGHGINATLDTYNYWVIQVIYIFKIKKNIKENIRYILGIINSKLINIYYYETFGEKFKKVFPHFRQKQFLELPIKKINFKIKKEELTHNRIVALVNDILINKEQFHKTKTPQEKTALQRQIDATDKQIDKLVYQLYGLTEKEIKIVVGSVK